MSKILDALVVEARHLAHNYPVTHDQADQFARELSPSKPVQAQIIAAIQRSPDAAEQAVREVWR